jgi:uncharacterized protein YidB (DUF937 family)
MDFNDLLKLGASLIQNNDDEATTGIDTDTISEALGSLFSSNDGEGGFDISSIISNLSNGNLMEVVSSWIGSGENQPINPDDVTELVGTDKIEEFANKLGVDFESAKKALADALPAVVDKATNEDESLVSNLLEKVGGLDGIMDMANKFFKS